MRDPDAPNYRRTSLLAIVGAGLIAMFAILPAPKLIFRVSPIVSPRAAGDVRRIVMAVEPNGIVHAALEVWIGSNWAIEYWTSIPKLTPSAEVVTHDLLENGDAQLALHGTTLWLAWVSHDLSNDHYVLHLTSHRDEGKHHDQGFPAPKTIATSSSKVISLSAISFDKDKPELTYTVGKSSFGPAVKAVSASGLPSAPKGATVVSSGAAAYAYKLAGGITVVTGKQSTRLASRLSCCPAVAEYDLPGKQCPSKCLGHLWVAWIVEQSANPIHHYVEIRYFGNAKRFTQGGRIPVIALTKKPLTQQPINSD
ncbi:MAG: hypothetical protein ACYDCC_02335 [Actinomycetota bacterium]